MLNIINKWESYEKFLNRLNNNPTVQTLFFSFVESNLNNIKDILIFFDIFETYNSDQIHNIQFNFDNHIIKSLYETKCDGIGKGELLCLIAIKNSKIMGQNSDFDLLLDNGMKIEVKAYLNSKNIDIRLGHLGSILGTKFYWKVSKYLELIANIKDNYPNIKDNIIEILKYKDKILKGEISEKLLKKFNVLFVDLKYIGHIYRDIKKLDCIEISNDFFGIKSRNNNYIELLPITKELYIINKLLNMEYTKYHDNFTKDLNDIKDQYIINDNINFLIFYNKSNIYFGNNPKDFKVKRISQGKIRIKFNDK